MEKNQKNIVIYDWLSFTSKKHTPQEIIAALGLSHCPWTETKGARGYMDRLYFGCISVHYNGSDDMGVWCEMSGQGCRNFEDFSTIPGDKWATIFNFIKVFDLHMTRLDVAYDDHTGVLDIDRIVEDVEAQRFISPMKRWQTIHSSVGTSVQIGSPQSKVLIRIYDKAAERGYTDDTHWVRVELQLRDDRGYQFINIPMPPGEAFAGVLLNYLRFVQPDQTDSNKSRWETADYWYNLIGDVSRISIYTAPGAAYNLERCKRYVFGQAGNAIDCVLQCCDSFDDFLTLVQGRPCAPNPKYDLIVKEYEARQQAFADTVKLYFSIDDVE